MSPPLLRDIRAGRSSSQTESSFPWIPGADLGMPQRFPSSAELRDKNPLHKTPPSEQIPQRGSDFLPPRNNCSLSFLNSCPRERFPVESQACPSRCYLPGTAPEQGGELGLKNKGEKKLNKQQTGMGMLVWDPLSLTQRLESKRNSLNWGGRGQHCWLPCPVHGGCPEVSPVTHPGGGSHPELDPLEKEQLGRKIH